MSYDLFARAYYSPDENRDRDAGGCNNDASEISRHRKGSSGNRRHWCVGAESPYLRYNQDGSGHNPCQGHTNTRIIGGGVDGRGNQQSYPGYSENFSSAPVALTCKTKPNYIPSQLVEWSTDNHMQTAGANDTSTGTWKNLWKQIIFGITTQAGSNPNGFCGDVNNLPTVVHQNGSTCYSLIGDALEQKQRGIEYCQKNPSDSKCKCINVARSDFLNYCQNNPSLPGCDEINAAVASYEKVGVLRTATSLMGNQDCLVPGICSGDIYQPNSQVPTCQNQVAICNQLQNLTVKQMAEAANLKAFQTCDIDFYSNQVTPSGTPSGTPSVSETSGAPSGAPSGTPSPPPSPPPSPDDIKEARLGAFGPFIPVSLNDLKTDTSKQISFIISVLCFIALLIVAFTPNKKGGFVGRFRY